MALSRVIPEMYICNSEAFGEGELGRERQERVSNLRVAVVGNGLLGQMILGCMYGLGVGNVYFFDDSQSICRKEGWFLYGHTQKIIGKKKSELVAEALHQINPTVREEGRHGRFTEAFIYKFNPNILIDATNDPLSKGRVLGYALSSSSNVVPVISVASDDSKGAITCYWPKNLNRRIKSLKEEPDLESILHREFEYKEQGSFTSGIIAGLTTEEVRKFAFQYGDEDRKLESNRRLVYNLYSDTRRGMRSNLKPNPIPRYRKKRVLVVGAGALGNWASVYLSQLGIGQVDFVDFDKAEIRNLNRQIQLRGRIGEKKAQILSERIREIDPYVKSRSFDGKLCYDLSDDDVSSGIRRIRGQFLRRENYDVILGCVDNKEARIWLNEFAIRHRVPYIDGGTHPKEGQLAVYLPGITSPVGEQLDLDSFPDGGTSCVDHLNPSVVMSNAIIAAGMVGELLHIFDYGLNEKPLDGPFSYSTSLPGRFYVEKRIAR